MIPVHTRLQRSTFVAPFGVRFVDAATGRPIAGGLRVAAFPTALPRRRVGAVRTLSGVYAFHQLPLLGRLPGPAPTDIGASYWDGLVKRTYRVEVADPEGRYLPGSFQVDLPRRGAAAHDLFSAPSRRAPPGMALLHLTLSGPAAAWAQVEVASPGLNRPYRGLADASGRLALVFPYPEPDPAGSPPTLRLDDLQWTLDLRAVAGPGGSPPSPPDAAEDPPLFPDLADLERAWSGPQATLLDDGSPPQTVTQAILTYRRPYALNPNAPGVQLKVVHLAP